MRIHPSRSVWDPRALRAACSLMLPMLLAARAVGTEPITLFVDAAPAAVSTPIVAEPGQSYAISATGTVDLAFGGGSYITDPDGVIQAPPPRGSPAYQWFTIETDPHKVAPAIGQKRFTRGAYRDSCAMDKAPFGALVAAFGISGCPRDLHQDFSPWTLVGSSGSVTAPMDLPIHSRLYLGVNDIWYQERPDNTGAYRVTVSTVPEPGALALLALAAPLIRLRRR